VSPRAAGVTLKIEENGDELPHIPNIKPEYKNLEYNAIIKYINHDYEQQERMREWNK